MSVQNFLSPMERFQEAWLRWDDKLSRWSWMPTAEGWLWIIVTVLVLSQSWVRGLNLVTFISGFLLGLWCINAVATFFARRFFDRIRIIRRAMDRTFAGSSCPVQMSVENTSRSYISGLRIIPGDKSWRWGVPFLEAKSRLETMLHLRMGKRGRYQLSPLRACLSGPFGLFRRTKLMEVIGDSSILVLPHLGKIEMDKLRRYLREGSYAQPKRERAHRVTSPADFYGVREYRTGDSPRLIHWRTTARTGELMVREFEEPPHEHVTVLLEAYLPEATDEILRKWRRQRGETERLVKLIRKTGKKEVDQAVQKRFAELKAKELTAFKDLFNLEKAVSFVATLCWALAKLERAHVTLVVADAQKEMQNLFNLDQIKLGVWPMLERLAEVQASQAPLYQRAENALMIEKPRGSLLLVSPHNSGWGKTVENLVNRKVRVLNIADPLVDTLFTCPMQMKPEDFE